MTTVRRNVRLASFTEEEKKYMLEKRIEAMEKFLVNQKQGFEPYNFLNDPKIQPDLRKPKEKV